MMEDTDEFKWALKVVIKRQMRDLMEQLRERGEEIAIMTVNLDDNTCSHFGSPNGEWFMSEQKNITQSFLSFCQINNGKKGGVRTASPQKKKSISTLKDSSSKQNVSSEIPEVRVTVPKHLAGDLSEEDVAGLVGRIVATHLAVQEKGDGSSSGTQFDILVRAANHPRQRDMSISTATPTRSSRKRKPTAKFMEGMNTLKKSKKSEEEDAGSEMESGNDETSVISLLSELSNTVLRRVKVSISDDKSVNLEKSDIDASETSESLALFVIQELDAISGGLLANKKSIKLTVMLDDVPGDDVHIAIGCGDFKAETVIEPNADNLDFDAEIDPAFDDGDSDMEDELPDRYPEADVGDCNTNVVKRKYKPRAKKEISTRKLPHACDVCGKFIVGRNNLEAHVRRVHLREKNYKCTICSKAFFTNSDVDAHMLSVHTRKCQLCGEYVIESVPWEDGTSMQSKRVVVCKCGNDVNIACAFGRRRTYESDNLRRKDTDKTQYACEHCGKLFTRRSHCVRHSKLHTGVKDIICQFCGELFRYKSSLRKHLAAMHRIFDYPCKLCSDRFTSTGDLEAHMKIHEKQGHIASSAGQDEQSQTVMVLSKKWPSAEKPEKPTAAVSTITNEQPETYSIQLVHDVLHGLQQFAGDGSSIIIKSVDTSANQ